MPNPNGGYLAVNFSGIATGGTVPGLFKQLERNKKAVLVEGLTITGTLYNAQFGFSEKKVNDYVITIPAGTITVTNVDKVTFAVTEAA